MSESSRNLQAEPAGSAPNHFIAGQACCPLTSGIVGKPRRSARPSPEEVHKGSPWTANRRANTPPAGQILRKSEAFPQRICSSCVRADPEPCRQQESPADGGAQRRLATECGSNPLHSPRSGESQFTGVTLATRPPWRWICCWASSILSNVTKRTVLLRLCRR